MSGGAAPSQFEFGGRVYSPEFSTNALCSLEDEFGGLSIVAIGERVAAGKAGVRGPRALFRAALSGSDPDLTSVQAGLIMEDLGTKRTEELVQEAFDRLKAGVERSVNLPSPDARGRISFEAGRVRVVLAFHMNAQAEMEAYFDGLKPEQISARLKSGGASLQDVRALFRAALIDHREVSLEEAGLVMDRIGIKVAGEAVRAAFDAAFPPALEDEDEEVGNRAQRRAARSNRSPTRRPARADGTGKRS